MPPKLQPALFTSKSVRDTFRELIKEYRRLKKHGVKRTARADNLREKVATSTRMPAKPRNGDLRDNHRK